MTANIRCFNVLLKPKCNVCNNYCHQIHVVYAPATPVYAHPALSLRSEKYVRPGAERLGDAVETIKGGEGRREQH